MIKREQERIDAVWFAGMLLILMLAAGIGFQSLSGSGNNIFHGLKDVSLAYQMKRDGYIVEYVDSGYMAYGVDTAGYLLDGLVLEQDFTVTEEMLQYKELAVGIQIGTYSRKNKVNLYVELYQDSGFGKAYKVDCQKLEDNKDVDILFETEGLQAETCHVRLYSDATDAKQAVTVYTTENCVLASEMRTAGTAEQKNLVMRVFTPYGSEKNIE